MFRVIERWLDLKKTLQLVHRLDRVRPQLVAIDDMQLLGRIIGQPTFQVLRVLPWIQTPATPTDKLFHKQTTTCLLYIRKCAHKLQSIAATLSMHLSQIYDYSFYSCHENSDFARQLCNWKSHTVCMKRKLKSDQNARCKTLHLVQKAFIIFNSPASKPNSLGEHLQFQKTLTKK
jgi:hypothetical protein